MSNCRTANTFDPQSAPSLISGTLNQGRSGWTYDGGAQPSERCSSNKDKSGPSSAFKAPVSSDKRFKTNLLGRVTGNQSSFQNKDLAKRAIDPLTHVPSICFFPTFQVCL
jgi:hypothetical protein